MRTIVGLLIMSVSLGVTGGERSRPIVGAIRWDAWTGGAITEQVERTLGPKKYHHRLPWFAEVLGDDKVRIDGGKQSVMEQEIAFASDAGLDYWAFLIYPESSPMSTALKQYLKGSNRKKINFCLIVHNTLKVSEKQWPKERDRAVALLKEPGYQKVLGGRPLVFAYRGRSFPFDRFAELLAAFRKAGHNPYTAYMGWNPGRDYKEVSSKGFDAVSAYARGGSQAKFPELAKDVENTFWQNALSAQAPYVPLVTTGWEKNPRKDNPVSWEKGSSYHKQDVFPSQATPKEITDHLGRAIAFVKANPKICPANAIIIYAWNEHDEGGWLSPTRSADGKPDTGRLDGIRALLRP